MATKSAAGRLVRKSAADIPAASAADLDRLRAAMKGEIDTSDLAERRGAFQRIERGAGGRPPARRSAIREAVKREMERMKITPYRVWKEARAHCPTLSQSAVHEFLKGQRQVELPYAEALMAALHLRVARVARVAKQEKARGRSRASSGDSVDGRNLPRAETQRRGG